MTSDTSTTQEPITSSPTSRTVPSAASDSAPSPTLQTVPSVTLDSAPSTNSQTVPSAALAAASDSSPTLQTVPSAPHYLPTSPTPTPGGGGVHRASPSPPEGGYGWVVVGSYACCMFLVTHVTYIIGMLFKDFFKILEITGAEASVLLNVNNGLGQAVGLVTGPAINKFGSRLVGTAGGLLFSIGITGTSFATSFTEAVVCYGVISAVGFSLSVDAFSFALHTYFRSRRGLAVGVSLAFTAVANICWPQVLSALQRELGSRGSLLVLSGITLHVVVAAVLLQPVEWHRDRADNKQRALAEDDAAALPTEHLEGIAPPEKGKGKARKSMVEETTFWRRVCDVLDLSLLRDPLYVTLMVAVALSYLAETNFMQFTPFFLASRGFSNQDIATLMSTAATTDCCFRLVAPLVLRLTGQPSIVLYSVAMVLLSALRLGLVASSTFTAALLVAVPMGAARGMRVVFHTMVIPDNLPVERLASAQGLRGVANGVFFFLAGPALGLLQRTTGNYDLVMVTSALFFVASCAFLAVRFVLVACRGRAEQGASPASP